MARTRVRLNKAGVAALLNDPGVSAELARRMGPVLTAARATAPVDTGELQASLELVVDSTDRARARVGSGVDYADVVEAGTGFLSRALDAAGGG